MGRMKEKIEYTEELIQDRLHTHFMSMSNIKHVMENLFVFAWESDGTLIGFETLYLPMFYNQIDYNHILTLFPLVQLMIYCH